MTDFKTIVLQGIPKQLPEAKLYDTNINHAPKRKDSLNTEEKKLALKNALRYFDKAHHAVLAKEFAEELKNYGRIYMYRFRPDYKIYARPISDYPYKSLQAAAIMHMLSNNLDYAVAQHPHELITYGGNGAVFQNWAQYLLTMQYLANMSDEQTLVMYSGHPMGLFPSHKDAPRVVITNGMMIPNYSKPNDWEKFNALGVTQYGQMTAGSYMYIGPQGIVHGTTITVMNAARKKFKTPEERRGKLFVTCGLGGMSGAQPKAAKIAGLVSITAEINPKAVATRHSQKWVDEVFSKLDELIVRVKQAMQNKEAVSLAYEGNVVDLWERLVEEKINVDIGTDQSSLHNPWAGGYYPVGFSLQESNQLMAEQPEKFKVEVQKTLVRHINAVNTLHQKGMYFFDYGNAFLLEVSRAGGDVFRPNSPDFKYNSYVQDILGPMCFDYGFGPFRWVCTSAKPEDLAITDALAQEVLEEIYKTAPDEIKQQLHDNIVWIKEAQQNNLVVGSQARILYADSEGRVKIASTINKAIKAGKISAPVVLGRDHHDVSGTDSPYRETSNIYDGSKFTADMAVQNFVGDAFRGATWISLHNGGGVGWGEVINGGFGLVLDGSEDAERRLQQMLFWDVNNGISRRAWARNDEALFAIKREMQRTPGLEVTLPNLVDEDIINQIY
jgi:urocanate hydratase